jgi:3-methyladenine DNA glycosylase AlkD
MLLVMASASNPSPVAATVLDRLVPAFQAAAAPEQAGQMRAYMRDQFPFLGIPVPRRRVLARTVLAGLARPTEADLRVVALACWELPEREYQLFAADWLRRHCGVCSSSFVDTARTLITTRSWWDTVDTLAGHLVGPLVLAHPQLTSTMDEWIASDQLWLARAAILHQLTYKQRTDAGRLFAYCEQRASDKEFFIRKAIGWALREYSKTDERAVRTFVAEHSKQLSGLSRTEALKWLARRAAR